MDQPTASDLGFAQVELLQVGEALEVLQPAVGDRCAFQIEILQLREARQVLQPAVGDPWIFEEGFPQAGQRL